MCDFSGEEEDVGGAESPVTQFQVHLPAIPAEQNAAESWDSLEEVQNTHIQTVENAVTSMSQCNEVVCVCFLRIYWSSMG